MNYVWNYVLTSWLLVKFLVLSLVHAQLEYTSVVDVNRGPSSIYCPGGAFITILNISVKNEEYCESEPCIIDDGDHEVLRRLCDNSTNCLINESILSSACLLEHRRFNLSYFCEAPISLHCNFENDLLCSLDQERDDDFDWTRNSGRTPSTGTGPDSDHTTGYGFYFFIEANSKRKKQKAKLISKLIVCKYAKCLTFWYHMYGNHIGSLSVYLKQGMQLNKIWERNGIDDDQWKQAKVDLHCNEQFQIVFEGKIKDSKHHWLGDIALDDIFVFSGSCENMYFSNHSQDEEYNDSCLSINLQYQIQECETLYLQRESLNLTFYPSFTNSDNEKECTNKENEIEWNLYKFCTEHFLLSNCEFSLESFILDYNECVTFKKRILITYLCTDEKTTTVLSDSTSGDSSAALETTTVSSFTTSKEGSSTVSVESVTLSRVMKNSSDSATGLVVGLVIGGLLLACAVIFIVVLFRRHTLKSRPREKLRNNLGGNDYIGSQDIVLPQTSNHSSRMQNDGMYDQLESRNTSVHGYESTQINNVQQKYTSVGADNGVVNKEGVQTPTYAVRRDKTFADNHMPNDDEYAIVDPTAETSFNETIDNSTGTADSYMVLDPTETGFNRQIFSTSPVGYEFAKPVQDTENKICGEDQYDISDEGVYDHSGSNRHKESEDNIYNHAVDTIYDAGSHKRNNEGREDTYDHFLGQTTEDDYDISTTT